MANLNKVLMIGNLTRDPQLSYLPSQTPVVEFGLATNRRWTSQDGDQREETCFVDCRCYGRQAETLNKYVHKGSPLFIEGRLQLDTWTSQDGQRRSKHRIFIETFQFLGSPSRDRQTPDSQASAASQAPAAADGSAQSEDSPAAGAQTSEDDIPF